MVIGISIFTVYYIVPEFQYEHIDSTSHVVIESIGVNEAINNVSINNGVYQDRNVLFGHRTTHGAPFFNLDKLQVGDSVQINNIEYTVTNTTIVSADYQITVNDHMYLVTCTPIGSTDQRIVVELTEV